MTLRRPLWSTTSQCTGDAQPGQAIPIADEKRVGKWEITKFHGDGKRERKSELVEGCEAMLAAVKQARERADPVSVVGPVFGFLIG